MPIVYRLNILEALKDAGYSSYRIRKDRLMGEATLQKLREEELVSWENVSMICKLLSCQPGDLVEYIPNDFSPSGDTAP